MVSYMCYLGLLYLKNQNGFVTFIFSSLCSVRNDGLCMVICVQNVPAAVSDNAAAI